MDEAAEARFIALETRFSYLERFIEQLNGQVVAHDRTIQKLTAENTLLRARLHEIQEAADVIPNRRPPHY
ncbi:MAG: SlyX family protein [Treponema sp.]|nr:SlyX family protein [Treponema sp.]